MWNASDRVEDSPRSGGRKLDSTSGLQWEGRGSRSCLHYGMAAAVEMWMGAGHSGSSGVINSYHHIHSCRGPGCVGRAGERERKAPMMYAPRAYWDDWE
ncbi:unnamed protein product [Pleuronectes platessa]|uniref:Uncharacterized protein n=1 Tax=Pleuronectes platessa TaxID=8262 RepID=A0A9N7UDR8_PLEPL|nr:unnamed protein product [Pleuronectes platessa]